MTLYLTFATIVPLALVLILLRHLRLSAPAKPERVL
jgi:hypothetical protein